MAVAEELQILVDAKVSAAIRDLKKTQKETDNLGKAAKSLGNALKAALPAVGFAGLAAATGQLISLASAAGEATNAVNVTFKEASDTIDAFGDTTATAIGLSKTEFSGLATVIGAQLKLSGLGMDQVADQTINLTTRAADLASVFNVDVAEATTALGAALRGETEPARRFGINISDAAVQAEALASGLVSSKSEITDQIKVQARLNLIFQQSKDVAGDFSNTSDGLANQLRILDANAKDLGASLGEVFLPAATDSVTALNDMLGPAKLAIDTFKDIIDALKGIQENTALWQQAMTRATNPVTVVVDRIKELYGLVGFLLREEEQVTVAKEEQLSLADGILAAEQDIAAQNKTRAIQAQAVADSEKAIADQLERQQALIDDKYLEIRGQVLDIINGEKTELESLEEQYDELAAHPWASGQLEEDRLRAMQILQDKITDLTTVEINWADEAAAAWNRADEAFFENVDAKEAALQRQIDLVNDLATTAENALANSFVSAFGAVGEALVDGENAMRAFAKAALMGFAAMLDSIAAQLAGYAVLGLFTTGGTLSGPALAGAAAAATAAGVTRATAAGFQQGTPVNQPFTVPGTPGRDSQPIMVEPGEEVTVNSRARSARGDSRMANITLNIDGRAFGKLILDLSRDRVVTLDRGALVAT